MAVHPSWYITNLGLSGKVSVVRILCINSVLFMSGTHGSRLSDHKNQLQERKDDRLELAIGYIFLIMENSETRVRGQLLWFNGHYQMRKAKIKTIIVSKMHAIFVGSTEDPSGEHVIKRLPSKKSANYRFEE
uniref:Uncharacterized protein n=1 Tax=Schistocephalus solidus TaxID=70667 RepID=A0A0V0JCV7_SCHSO